MPGPVRNSLDLGSPSGSLASPVASPRASTLGEEGEGRGACILALLLNRELHMVTGTETPAVFQALEFIRDNQDWELLQQAWAEKYPEEDFKLELGGKMWGRDMEKMQALLLRKGVKFTEGHNGDHDIGDFVTFPVARPEKMIATTVQIRSASILGTVGSTIGNTAVAGWFTPAASLLTGETSMKFYCVDASREIEGGAVKKVQLWVGEEAFDQLLRTATISGPHARVQLTGDYLRFAGEEGQIFRHLGIEQILRGTPKWQPDSDAPVCTSCNRTFGIRRRRHHCRSCGKIFCRGCSQGKKDGRMCTGCRGQARKRQDCHETLPFLVYTGKHNAVPHECAFIPGKARQGASCLEHLPDNAPPAIQPLRHHRVLRMIMHYERSGLGEVVVGVKGDGEAPYHAACHVWVEGNHVFFTDRTDAGVTWKPLTTGDSPTDEEATAAFYADTGLKPTADGPAWDVAGVAPTATVRDCGTSRMPMLLIDFEDKADQTLEWEEFDRRLASAIPTYDGVVRAENRHPCATLLRCPTRVLFPDGDRCQLAQTLGEVQAGLMCRARLSQGPKTYFGNYHPLHMNCQAYAFDLAWMLATVPGKRREGEFLRKLHAHVVQDAGGILSEKNSLLGGLSIAVADKILF